MLRFSGVAVSHAGLVRPGNEDAGFLGSSCMLVADGVGGAAAGEIASATAARVVSGLAMADPSADPLGVLRRAVVLSQEQIALGVRREPARTGMATTLTAVVTDGQTFALAHVGDSRGYVLREGRLTRITTDHSYVQWLVDQGILDEGDAAGHPLRNVVTRSVDGTVAEAGEVTPLRLLVGDRVLLASDGLTDLIAEPNIEALIRANPDAAAVEALLEAALYAGGTDNVTCVLATVVAHGAPASNGVLVGSARDPRNVVGSTLAQLPTSA